MYKSIIEKQHRYDRAYMGMAREFSKLSYAERAKVGCIIVSSKGQVVSQGYNGMPSGMDNRCEHEDENGNIVTNTEVLHAESNAITKCAKWGSSTEGCTIYITLSPCVECAKLIIQAGIRRVVYGERYRNTEGIELLERANIIVEQISE
ncbi:dCMP deaminase [gut metagenome]|uniref:dCMP deaminase n=1 Tax=gut metagenome TaxID=749906 RepID=J9F406_9ZZZZ